LNSVEGIQTLLVLVILKQIQRNKVLLGCGNISCNKIEIGLYGGMWIAFNQKSLENESMSQLKMKP
jgi:hypothetical protein